MKVTSISDVIILMIAASVQILIGMALVKAGRKAYGISKIEQFGQRFRKVASIVIWIGGWFLILWAIVYTVTQIVRSV